LSDVGSLSRSADSRNGAMAVNAVAAAEQPAPKKWGVRELWAAWKRIARKIGDFQARVLLTIFYFVLLAPFAIVVRRTSDPLALKPGTQRGWGVLPDSGAYTVEKARKQF
jgi:hypothetical protein